MQFISPTKGEMDLTQVVKDILDYVSDELNYTYKLIVGTDSQPHEDKTCFVSAIIIHRIGKGARYYYNKQFQQNIISMRQRIFYEASLSLALADQVCRCLKEFGRDDLKVEIHLDVGSHGATRELIKEVIGMVVGSGFDAKIKPYSCGASKVADKYTK